METKNIEMQQQVDDGFEEQTAASDVMPVTDEAAEEEAQDGEQAEQLEQPEASPENKQSEQSPELLDRESVERLIAEAEERGYKRGLDEQGRRMLKRPRLYETAAHPHIVEEVLILNNPRRSVWDD